MALWEAIAPDAINNVRLSSVRVKGKACIYNDLRLTAGFGFIASDQGGGAREGASRQSRQ
jgi:hypothetical protein